MKTSRYFFFVTVLLLFLSGCSKEKPQGNPLALVDGSPIYEEYIPEGGTLDQAIDREILYQEAIRRGIDKDKKVQGSIREVVVGTFLDQLYTSVGEVTVEDDEVKNYYDEHQNEFLIIRGAEIVLNDKAVAEEVYRKALSGEDFKNLVKEYSKSLTKARGGETTISSNYHGGLFLDKEIGEIVLVDDKGDTYRVIKLVEKSYAPFDIAKSSIKTRMVIERKGELVKDITEKLKKEKKIEILSQK